MPEKSAMCNPALAAYLTLLYRGYIRILELEQRYCSGCLLFLFHLLLQGVAQLDPTGEGLAKRPETAEEIRGRLQSAFVLLSVAVCGSFVFQAAGVLSNGGKGCRSSVRKAAFAGIVFWAGVCLFFE